MYCPKCGAQVSDGSAFCNLCGARLNVGDAPPFIIPFPGNAPTGVSSRSAIVYFLFGFFLGSFGIHNFYVGKTTLGVVQLVVSLVGLALAGIPTLGVAIWALVESIMGLCGKITDAEGLPLRK